MYVYAFEKAVAAGSYRAVNSVMLGALASTGLLPFSKEQLLKALLELVPERAKGINEKAFQYGVEF